MPKRVNNIYDNSLTFSKIRAAYYRTLKRKKKNAESIRFGMYLEDNILKIYKQLKNETYTVGEYRFFKVFEPKEREIYSLPFYDRVVQQFYVHEYITPYMLPKFIPTSFACIPGRGLHKCVSKVQEYMNLANKRWPNAYVLKFDVKKFFYSIDRNILYKIIERNYKDKKFLRLTKEFIRFNPEQSIGEGKGLPIGNYTSQYYANIYLNELDQFIKNNLKVKYYVRFMDDGLLILENKEKAIELLSTITEFLENKLDLRFNKKTTYFPLKKRNNILRI